jgi:iron complex outermembrane recepter protein
MRVAAAVACVLLSAVSLSAASEADAAIRKSTDIPAGDLGPALETLAKQRDLQLLYRSDLVNARQSAGANGDLTLEQALTQVLKNTGLTFRYLDQDAITIVPLGAETQNPETTRAPARTLAPASVGGGTTQTTNETQKKPFWERFRLAQADSTANRGASSLATPEQSRPVQIEEVTVTAQKRTERLQDVPISMTAITAEEISQRGMTGAGDYLRGIPGVNQQEQAYQGQAVVIRGLETSFGWQNWVSGGPMSSTYFGETPMTNSAGLLGSSADIKLVDIERVEVLRGPQGTAFGNASMTGAVRLIPVAPNLDAFAAKLAAGYSTTSDTGDDNHSVQAVLNVPLMENRFAVRAVGYRFEESGFYSNRAASNAALRAAVVTPFGVEAFALNRDNVGSSTVLGGRISALFQATDDLRFTLSYLTQKSEINGFPQANTGPYEQSVLAVAPQHIRRGQELGASDSTTDVANALMEYDLGWADLLATYSYIESDSDHTVPLTLPLTAGAVVGIPWPASFHAVDPHREHSAEVRLATKFDGAWNFLAGLFAEDHDDLFETHWLWYGNPRPLGDAPLNGWDRRTQKHAAAFGEVSWEFLPRFTLTAGARAYDYERDGHLDEIGPLAGGTRSVSMAADASGTTYRANLSFKPSEDSLIYAGWGQGFRLGRPQATASAVVCDLNNDGFIDGTNISLDSTGEIKPDSVDSYELGGKVTLLDRRLAIDAAIFRMDWVDFPVAAPVPVQQGCGGVFINVGTTRSEGVELQTNFQISDTLRADLGGSYVDARVTEDSPTGTLRVDDRLGGAPRATANFGLQQSFSIAGHSAFVRGDSIYVGPFYGTHGARRLFPPNPRSNGDYIKLDVTAGMAIRQLDINVYVRNLTNEDAFLSGPANPGNPTGTSLRPRTIGVQLGYSFGR